MFTIFYRVAPVVYLVVLLLFLAYAVSDKLFNRATTYGQFFTRVGLAIAWPLAVLSPAGRKILIKGFA